MKKIVSVFLVLLVSVGAFSQTGYNIKLTLKPFQKSLVYLAYYYGKVKAVADSVVLDENSNGVFKGKEKLPGGIYFIVSPRKEILFELLIDQQQDFSIVADTTDLVNHITFTGSTDNSVFQSYTHFVAKDGKEITDLQALLSSAKTKQDSTKLLDRMKVLNKEIQDYRDDIEKKYPASLLTTLFRAMKDPVVPPADKQPGGKYDSQYAFHYYKAHYWDGISFTDDRLVRTPILEPKIERYYKDLVTPTADSINREVDWMLLYSRSNKEMFKFLMVHFVQKYINPEFMGQDAVFVHIFDKFINTGEADFFTEKYRKFINDRAYSLMANLIGQPAANLEMVDTANKPTPLYGVQAQFTVVCFWDPTCSHCKETVPKLDSIYQAKWKNEGVKLYGVMVDGGKDNWLKFIREHNLKGWIHVYETQQQHDAVAANNQAGYKQLYDVYQTPTIFLLDKDKRIIAKRLSYQQLDEVINLKLKNSKSN
jgi:hypothetical protein